MNNYTKTETDHYGNIFYYNDKDQYHKTDGPAVEYAGGGKAWWVNGECHRLDGPAAEYADGSKYWYVNGEYLTEKEFNKHPLVIERMLGKIIDEVLEET